MIIVPPVVIIATVSKKDQSFSHDPGVSAPGKNNFSFLIEQENAQFLHETPQIKSHGGISASAPSFFSYHPGSNIPIEKENMAKPLLSELSFWEQIQRYKEEQLLSNPGGDSVEWQEEGVSMACRPDVTPFWKRIGKDLKDTAANLVNLWKDIGSGAAFNYFTKNGEIHHAKNRGLLKIAGNFFMAKTRSTFPATSSSMNRVYVFIRPLRRLEINDKIISLFSHRHFFARDRYPG